MDKMDKKNAKVKKQCPDCQKQFVNLKLHQHKTHNKVWVICCEKFVSRDEVTLDCGGIGKNLCNECFT